MQPQLLPLSYSNREPRVTVRDWIPESGKGFGVNAADAANEVEIQLQDVSASDGCAVQRPPCEQLILVFFDG